MTSGLAPPPITPSLTEHLHRLSESFARWTGRELIAAPRDSLAERLFEAPFVLLSHDIEPDPILNYGNRMALVLWEMTWERLTRTPSRLTAEAPLRNERARLLEDVARRGYIEDYEGLRISSTGRRFFIERAVVWSVRDEEDRHYGQAAMFDQWTYRD